MIWNWIKTKKPICIYLKKRLEHDNISVVCSKNLEFCYLNETATYIIELCDGNSSLEEIKNRMLSDFEVDEQEITNDIISIVRTLQWKRIIKLKD